MRRKSRALLGEVPREIGKIRETVLVESRPHSRWWWGKGEAPPPGGSVLTQYSVLLCPDAPLAVWPRDPAFLPPVQVYGVARLPSKQVGITEAWARAGDKTTARGCGPDHPCTRLCASLSRFPRWNRPAHSLGFVQSPCYSHGDGNSALPGIGDIPENDVCTCLCGYLWKRKLEG